jgi:ATP phosphoribosyltransferase regulatory subunit
VRDFLPRAAARRHTLAQRLLSEFSAWGYERIITPVFEVAEVLERGLGVEARAAAIRFVEPESGEVVALRPDITPQVARLAATRLADAEGPIRLCYEGAVTRVTRGARGQREILQAGVELIGAGAPDADAEAISVALAALLATDIDEFRLELGHVALVRAALEAAEDPAARAELERALARKDRSAVRGVARHFSADRRRLCEALPTLYGEPDEVMAQAQRLPLAPLAQAALERVAEVIGRVRDLVGAQLARRLIIDLGEVQGFDYYTGMRFHGYLSGAGHAVLRGGRYDELIGRYGQPACATGFAVDIEAVAEAQSAHGVAAGPAGAAVLVAAQVAAGRRRAARVAAALRACGVRAATHLGDSCDASVLGRYAAGSGFSHVLILERDCGQWLGGKRVTVAELAAAEAGDASALAAQIAEE